jgi:hypothetical protein
MRRSFIASIVLAISLHPGAMLAAEEAPPDGSALAPAGTLAEPRAEHTATLLRDGRVLVIAGTDWTLRGPTSAEVWDPQAADFGPAGTGPDFGGAAIQGFSPQSSATAPTAKAEVPSSSSATTARARWNQRSNHPGQRRRRLLHPPQHLFPGTPHLAHRLGRQVVTTESVGGANA